MRYGLREEPRDYSHPEFLPIFLDEQSPADRQAAQNLCGATNLACIYDYIATGSAGIASATKSSASTASETEKISSMCCVQSSSFCLYIYIKSHFSFS